MCEHKADKQWVPVIRTCPVFEIGCWRWQLVTRRTGMLVHPVPILVLEIVSPSPYILSLAGVKQREELICSGHRIRAASKYAAKTGLE